MTILHNALSSDLFYRLGWSLLHSLWQFALMAFAPLERARRRTVLR